MKRTLIEAYNMVGLTLNKEYEIFTANGVGFFKDDNENIRACDYHTWEIEEC
tara:strand:- start:5203 stop:5358 length:156 start_codon:yes stop_codon:yes gene_type:complete